MARRHRKGRMPAGLKAYWAGKRRGGKARANPPGHKRRRHARRNPPIGGGGKISLKELAIDSASVLAGVGIPAIVLRTPGIANFAKEKWQRVLLKGAAGYALSLLASKFVSRRAGSMVLVGTGVGVALDLMPKLAPAVGLGMRDDYDPEQAASLNSVGEMIPAGIAEMLSGGQQYAQMEGGAGNEIGEMEGFGEMIPVY